VSRDFTRRDLIRAGGAGAAGLALFGSGACSDEEDSGAEARTTAAPPPNAMNVVVVVMDSLRADHIYGPRARTDAMTKVMQQGLRFTNAYPEGMPTIPARRAIMEGKRTFPFRGWKPRWDDLPPQPGWEPVGRGGEMWTEVLRRNGWTTGYVTDNPHLLLPVHKRFRRKFDRVELVDGQVPVRRKPKRRVSQREVDRYLPPSMRDGRAEPRMAAYLAVNPRSRSEKDYNAAKVFREGIGWIEWARAKQPFALVIDSFDAHEPWDVPKRLSDMYGSPDPSGVEPIQPFPTPAAKYAGLGLSQSLLHRMRELYAAEVTMVDTWLGKFLDDLANKGLLDKTLVVLCSDHGVLLGEYGWVGKRYTEVHTELSHVPFAIRHPEGKAKGKTSRYWASHHDIGPTVLSMLGYEKTHSMNGTDLSRLFDGKQPAQKRTYRTAAYAYTVVARDANWLLIADSSGKDKRLYSLHGELRNVNVARRYPQHVKRLWGYIRKDAGPKPLPNYR
jgi:arylsulfatase A-like enzyme